MEAQSSTAKQPTFGNLQINAEAKGKRCNQKFFDSAEWAMQQQNNPSIKPEQVKMTKPNVFKSLQLPTSEAKSPIIC